MGQVAFLLLALKRQMRLHVWIGQARVDLIEYSKNLVFMKASALVEDYVKECLLRRVEPNPPLLSHHWMRRWMREYRVSVRRPNRKYKVSPTLQLQERLAIFWTNMLKLGQVYMGARDSLSETF